MIRVLSSIKNFKNNDHVCSFIFQVEGEIGQEEVHSLVFEQLKLFARINERKQFPLSIINDINEIEHLDKLCANDDLLGVIEKSPVVLQNALEQFVLNSKKVQKRLKISQNLVDQLSKHKNRIFRAIFEKCESNCQLQNLFVLL